MQDGKTSEYERLLLIGCDRSVIVLQCMRALRTTLWVS